MKASRIKIERGMRVAMAGGAHICRRGREGSALMVVFVLIIASGVAMMLSMQAVRVGQTNASARVHGVQAMAMAEQGIALAANPNVDRWDPLLNVASEDGGMGRRTTISSEGGRINPNRVLARNDEQLLINLFEIWGMDFDEASALVAAMADWIDEEGNERINGAGRSYYESIGRPTLPPNRPFASLEEIRMVRGGERLDYYRPGWEAFFTLHGDGRIDMNDAAPEVLMAATGAGEDAVEGFLEVRRGADNILGTREDITFQSVDEALAVLGGSPVPQPLLEERLTSSSDLQRIESTGWSGNHQRKFMIVVSRQQGDIVYERREEPVVSRQ